MKKQYKSEIKYLVNLIDSVQYLPNAFTIVQNDGKYVFGLVKVGEKGQIVIPKSARTVFEIYPGDRLMVLGDTHKGGIALAKIPGLGF